MSALLVAERAMLAFLPLRLFPIQIFQILQLSGRMPPPRVNGEATTMHTQCARCLAADADLVVRTEHLCKCVGRRRDDG